MCNNNLHDKNNSEGGIKPEFNCCPHYVIDRLQICRWIKYAYGVQNLSLNLSRTNPWTEEITWKSCMCEYGAYRGIYRGDEIDVRANNWHPLNINNVTYMQHIFSKQRWYKHDLLTIGNMFGADKISYFKGIHRRIYTAEWWRGRAADFCPVATEYPTTPNHSFSKPQIEQESIIDKKDEISNYKKKKRGLRSSTAREKRKSKFQIDRRQIRRDKRRAKSQRKRGGTQSLAEDTAAEGSFDLSQESQADEIYYRKLQNWQDELHDTESEPEIEIETQNVENDTEQRNNNDRPNNTRDRMLQGNEIKASIAYGEKLKIVSLNIRGPKCREVADYMKTKEIDIGCYQETKIPTNSKFKIDDYIFITSTDIKGGTQKKAIPIAKPKPKGKGRPKPKARPVSTDSGQQQVSGSLHTDTEIEHHGVMIVFHKKHLKALKWYKQISGNKMQACFKMKGPDLIVNNAYAPNSRAASFEKRETWFTELTQLLIENNGKFQITCGDLNARIHAKTDDDSQIGTHIFGRGMDFLKSIYLPEETNRTLMMQTLMDTDSYAMNTFFKKENRFLVTYRDRKDTQDIWIPENFAVIDYIIANNRAKNAVKNVYTDTKTELNTDHFPLIAEIKIKLQGQRKDRKEPDSWKNPQKPDTIEEVNDFYKEVMTEFGPTTPENDSLNQKVERLNHAFRKVATQQISKKQAIKREFNISDHTKSLIEIRQQARDRCDWNQVKIHTKQIRKSIRKDRTDLLVQNLEECLWYDIKKAKTGFVPNHVKLRKTDNTIARSNERPEVLADHYEKKQWGIDEDRPREFKTAKIFDYCSDIYCGDLEIEELFIILKKLKNAKAPGPDGIPLEFYKWLRTDTNDCRIVAQLVCDLINQCMREEKLPDELELAQVVTLYKKGNVEDPGNYRPISLLQSLYKIYATMIQMRLAANIEEKIWKTQYGFRAKHSTAEALYITRRIQDFYETHGDKFFMLFLDWEKAFDKVDQKKLINALYRLNIPAKILKIIESFYRDPKFRVKDVEGLSGYRKQRAGIRQGCPLSPYLFILLMTVIFHDVHAEVDDSIRAYKIDVAPIWELLYADDTMIMGNRAREINILLKQIEIESEKYNLKLNHDKCFYIGMNGKANIHFKDGKKIAKADKYEYLGGTITPNASRNAEISSRMSKALGTCKKLKLFWKKTNASIGWKIQVYNAIIISQLIYGLNTLNITPSIKDRLNAFHMRGIRYILNIDHSYYSRISNEEVLNRMNLAINDANNLNITWEQFRIQKEVANQHYKATKLVGDLILERQETLLGHVLRLEDNDLMRTVTCNNQLRRPYQLYKRTGATRLNWFDDNINRVFNKFNGADEYVEFDHTNQEHVALIKEKAYNREF